VAKVPNAVKILRKNLNRLSRAHERYRRQTDGRAIAYSERERPQCVGYHTGFSLSLDNPDLQSSVENHTLVEVTKDTGIVIFPDFWAVSVLRPLLFVIYTNDLLI